MILVFGRHHVKKNLSPKPEGVDWGILFSNRQIASGLDDPAHLSYRLNSRNDKKQITSVPDRSDLAVSSSLPILTGRATHPIKTTIE
jgi:hypothetical protein